MIEENVVFRDFLTLIMTHRRIYLGIQGKKPIIDGAIAFKDPVIHQTTLTFLPGELTVTVVPDECVWSFGTSPETIRISLQVCF
jgi:hypothetical protein